MRVMDCRREPAHLPVPFCRTRARWHRSGPPTESMKQLPHLVAAGTMWQRGVLIELFLQPRFSAEAQRFSPAFSSIAIRTPRRPFLDNLKAPAPSLRRPGNAAVTRPMMICVSGRPLGNDAAVPGPARRAASCPSRPTRDSRSSESPEPPGPSPAVLTRYPRGRPAASRTRRNRGRLVISTGRHKQQARRLSGSCNYRHSSWMCIISTIYQRPEARIGQFFNTERTWRSDSARPVPTG